MKAYLIGGPEDFVQLHVKENISVINFAHCKAEPVRPQGWPGYVDPVEIERVIYHKVYESPYGNKQFAVFVHVEEFKK